MQARDPGGQQRPDLGLALPHGGIPDNEDSFHDYYDEIEICDNSAGRYFKAAIQIRNRAMVDRSDLVVFYVEQNTGGAYQTMRYTKKSGVSFINLGQLKEMRTQ